MRKSILLIALCSIALAGCVHTDGPTDTLTGSNKHLAEAKQWVGTTAQRDRKELKNLMASADVGPVDPLRIPWCAGFANAVLVRNGYQGTGSLMARSFLNYGTYTRNPTEGDIVVLRRGRSQYTGHVGFFVGYEYQDGTKYVKVLGGNTNRSVDVGYYPVAKVLGYRKPEVADPS